FSKIDENYVVLLDIGRYVMPVVSGTVFDANGDSTLTLVEPWLGAALNHKKLLVIPVFAKIYESVAAMTALNEVTRGILLKLENVLSATTPTLEIAVGSTATIQTVPYGFVLAQVTALIDQLNSLVGSVLAPSKAIFFALAEQRKRESAGSGFAEWGNHVHEKKSAYYDHINEGLYVRSPQFLDGDYTNSLLFGRQGSLGEGVSLTESPLVNVNGYEISVSDVLNLSSNNFIKLPSAPDGLDKSDGTRYIDLAAAIIDGGTSLSHSVLSRQDFVFLEVWHEKISEKDIVVPLGNVQYGGTSLYGIGMNPLSTYGVPQGYSAFGHWDTNTEGRGRQWSTIDAASKTLFIQDHQNNIYSDNGELIQVRYRIRVVKGLGDDWDIDFNKNLYQDEGNLQYVHAQGKLSTISKEIGDRTSGNSGVFAVYNNGFNNTGIGAWAAVNQSYNSTDASLAQDGLCFAVPIALVQRRNQGAYHPSYNPDGCSTYWKGFNEGNGKWYESSINTTNTSDCFDYRLISDPDLVGHPVFHLGAPWGRIYSVVSNGQPSRPDNKAYDAIYASDVQDLRMSAKRLPLSEIREKAKRKAITGEVRGFEGVPFLKEIGSFTVVGGTTSYGRCYGSSVEITAIQTQLGNPADNSNIVPALIYNDTTGAIAWIGNIQDENNTVILCTNVTGIVGVTDVNTAILIQNSIIRFSATSLPQVKNSVLKYNGSISGADTSTLFPVDSVNYVITYELLKSKSANPTWTDIIGSPANIAATFPNGVEGQWIPVIPDGTSKEIKFNRKFQPLATSANTLTLRTADTGDGWVSTAYTANEGLNSLTAVISSAWVELHHYETQAHFTEGVVWHSELLDLGGVWATNDSDILDGNLLVSTLINKVGTNAGVRSESETPLTTFRRDFVGGVGVIYSVAGGLPEHQPLSLTHSNNSPTVKTLDYLSHDGNNQLTLNYVYKEMVWDASVDTASELTLITAAMSSVNTAYTKGLLYYVSGGVYHGLRLLCIATSSNNLDIGSNMVEGNIYRNGDNALLFTVIKGIGFGDNNQFEIASNQNTLTDDNGNSVLYGTARVALPYFYVGE
ncbi:MAG: hypothetical protein HRT38_14985, partial [Alteromonadaceae bacterium]|nr:hypothetical protein [Alteromonadaceae bacterium]